MRICKTPAILAVIKAVQSSWQVKEIPKILKATYQKFLFLHHADKFKLPQRSLKKMLETILTTPIPHDLQVPLPPQGEALKTMELQIWHWNPTHLMNLLCHFQK